MTRNVNTHGYFEGKTNESLKKEKVYLIGKENLLTEVTNNSFSVSTIVGIKMLFLQSYIV